GGARGGRGEEMAAITLADQVPRLRELARPCEPVASVYFDLRVPVGDAEEVFALRWRALAGRLLDGGADPETVAVLAARIAQAEPAPAELVMFAAGGRLEHAEVLAGLAGADTPAFPPPAPLPPIPPSLHPLP